MIPDLRKKRPARLDKRAIALVKAKQYSEVRKRVRERERGRCRICGKPGYEAHHVVYRSHGGKDEMKNLIWTCRTCHEDIHGHVIKLAGDARKLRVGRWNDSAHDWLWEAA